jgi:hypothetical protein
MRKLIHRMSLPLMDFSQGRMERFTDYSKGGMTQPDQVVGRLHNHSKIQSGYLHLNQSNL